MSTEGSGASRAGGGAFHNEDAFLVEEGLGLYVVCDGASGGPAGEIASGVAVIALEQFVRDAAEELGPDAVVDRGLHFAMRALLEAEQSRPELHGMATTVTMLLAQGSRGAIGHVGDSRAYLIRRGRAHQLTVDHELTDALPENGDADLPIDSFAIGLEPGDTLVLCTDGAEDVVAEREIVRTAGSLSPRLLASRIVSAAHRRHPDRDATVVVIRVRHERERGWLELSVPPREAWFGHAAVPAGVPA